MLTLTALAAPARRVLGEVTPPPDAERNPIEEVLPGEEVTLEAAEQFCTAELTRAPAVCEYVAAATNNDFLGRWAGNIVGAVGEVVLIVVVAFIANRLARRVIGRLVRRVLSDTPQRFAGPRPDRVDGPRSGVRALNVLASTRPLDVARAQQRGETVTSVLKSVATFVIYGFAVILVLGAIGIDVGPLIAGAGIAGIALGFGAQNLVKDFLSGVFMILEDQYGVGDIIDVGEATGVVEGVTLRTTRLRDIEGRLWHVPNGEIRRVGNMSQLWARSLMDVGVAYDTDVRHAIDVIKRVADSMWRDPDWADLILEEPEVWGVEAFTADAVVIRVVLKVEPAKQWTVNRELRARLLEEFAEEGIEIPLPQRVLHVEQSGLAGQDGDRDARRNGGGDGGGGVDRDGGGGVDGDGTAGHGSARLRTRPGP